MRWHGRFPAVVYRAARLQTGTLQVSQRLAQRVPCLVERRHLAKAEVF
jgi:hypothetical protein